MNERPAGTEEHFQQAKKSAQGPQFLQIVAKPGRRTQVPSGKRGPSRS